MRTLDETDFTILRLLVENSRRSYSEIADRVGMSSPAVSDRIDRLQDLGIVRRFTVDIDRSKLRGGVPVLVDLSVCPEAVEQVHESLVVAEGVEHVFTAAESRLLFQARILHGDVRTFLMEIVELDAIREYEVTLLTKAEWTPQVESTDLALTCAQCGNTVDEDGESLRLDDEIYYLCCQSCKRQFQERYDQFQAGADA